MKNPYRNGVMIIFDILSDSLKWRGFMHDVARMTLKNTLSSATEQEAYEYLKKINKLTDDVLKWNQNLREL